MWNGRVCKLASKLLLVTGVFLALVTLSGCGVGISTMTSNAPLENEPQTVPAVRINGNVHGGAYPIQNATVILMETQSTGVWSSASGAYVGTAKPLYATTSDALGSFSFPDTGWSCDAGQHVYIEVTGGRTTSATNANVVQVAVVGDCAADLGNKASIDAINVFLSEPSTVAVAYALRSFLSIHTGNLSGIASDGTVTLTSTLPLVDITAPANNNAVPANPSMNPALTTTGAVQVSLASAFNANGIYSDGALFTTGGLDNVGNAYSASLVGTTLTYGGIPYTLGSANQLDVVRGTGAPVISLPSGNFNTLYLLAAAVNGSQAAQSFTVTYTDGSTSTFSQGISDWFAGATSNYSGEAVALATTYRNTSLGGRDSRVFNVYQYSFPLNRAKLIKSLTLPNNNNVVLLAVTAASNLPTCSGVRAGTALICTAAGLAHGFQNAYNLVDQVTFNGNQMPSGVARTSLPGNSKSVVPREMINSLGNVLQECVDSNGGTVTPSYAGYTLGTTRCGDLFYYTTPPSSTASPTNTLQAAMNIATYPANNVNKLMALKPRTVFFTPEISQAASPQAFAFTLSIFYQGTSLGDTFTAPSDLALDAQDNLYVIYGQNGATLDEMTAGGSGVFSSALPSVSNPKSLALDANGYIWISDDTVSTGNVLGFYTSVNATKSAAQGSAYKTVTVANGLAAGLAFDASSNMFVTRDSNDKNGTAFLYTASSGYLTSTAYKLGFPFQRALANAQGNFYAVGSNGTSSQWLNFNYATCGAGTGPVASTLTTGNGISMTVNNNVGTTGAYNAFIPTARQMYTFLGGNCTSTVNSSPAGNQTGLSSTSPSGTAMDGNLGVFWSDAVSGLIYAMPSVGASTNIANAAVSSFAPCYFVGSACASTSGASFSGMAIDSSGAMWNLSRGGSYGLVQTLGMAAPTWPLLASENSGVTVQ